VLYFIAKFSPAWRAGLLGLVLYFRVHNLTHKGAVSPKFRSISSIECAGSTFSQAKEIATG
jgi:hypothetical protein